MNRLSHRGIRARVYLSLMLFGIALVVLLWLFQTVFLESFYRSQRMSQVASTAEQLAACGDTESMEDLAGTLAVRNDVSILLLDQDLNELLSVEGSRFSMIHRYSPMQRRALVNAAWDNGEAVTWQMDADSAQLMGDIEGIWPPMPNGFTEGIPPEMPELDWGSEGWGESEGEPMPATWEKPPEEPITRTSDASSVTAYILARPVTLADGTDCTLLLYTEITPVTSTVDTLRSELLIITAVVIIGMLLLAYGISSRVSLPIIETNEAAKSLARSSYTRPKHADSYREIAELNTTLEKAADELGKVEQLQHELIANISHDLRTPLTMIGGYAEAMRDIPDENTPENMQIIIDETARLSTLVSELLDFSRMQTGAVQMKLEVFDLTEEARNIADRVGKLTAKDGYSIDFEPEEHLTVKADMTRIGQVIYNLLGNALTYTGADKRVTVTQSVHEDRARIEIADSGKGIAPDELPLIWNRYYRTKETHRRAIIGSGLGLNIVQTILEQHGVPYGVESEQGVGTTFWFELPLAEE